MFYFICIYYRLFEANRPRIARTTCSTIPGGNISLDMVISRHVTVPSALAGVAHAQYHTRISTHATILSRNLEGNKRAVQRMNAQLIARMINSE